MIPVRCLTSPSGDTGIIVAIPAPQSWFIELQLSAIKLSVISRLNRSQPTHLEQ